ncbi:MAG TPA: alcohol dehydrogenase catalytic domain-containing protein [Candidatus Limnocylindria bacterium]|nr:alcohol dehydrogenase catalytic domain-containing protein [Candidatus Limnocylindria bacterium]
MRAVRLHAPGEGLRVEEVPLPAPVGTEVRIAVAGCGVCHSDVHIVDGVQRRVRLPLTLGHEVAGHLDAVGPAAEPLLADLGLAIGDPVLVYGGWGCGACAVCRRGDEQLCPRSEAPGFQRDGGYAEAMLVPHPRQLVRLDRLDPVDAAPLADAGVTSYRAVRRAEPWLVPGARVLVIGAGALGQFAIQLLRAVPAAGGDLVIGVREVNEPRLARAQELGANVTLLGGAPAQTHEQLGGPADVVLDLVGSDESLAHAAGSAATGGIIVLVGEAGGTLPFGLERLAPEVTLTSVAWGSPSDMRAVVDLAERGALRWNVERMPLAQATEAHSRVRAGDVEGRIVLVP